MNEEEIIKELESRHQRFMNGTETEDDLINGIYHYKIKNDNGLDLDVVELKYYQKILDLYNKEKEKNETLFEENTHWKASYFKLSRKIDVISKDKIREKIVELEDKIHVVIPNEYNKMEVMNEFKNEGAINVLKELLGE